MILTAEEMIAITKKSRYKAQSHSLDVMGVTYKKRADGSLIVSRAHIEHWLGVEQKTSIKKIEPDWSAILA